MVILKVVSSCNSSKGGGGGGTSISLLCNTKVKKIRKDKQTNKQTEKKNPLILLLTSEIKPKVLKTETKQNKKHTQKKTSAPFRKIS